ncbi:MAG: UxaA family hydrolase [Desulfobacterales bacterium]|nr:MAG: UxaA family hydrolase [Desulfobacterales bacterium]
MGSGKSCGGILDGDATIEEVGNAIFDLILKTASGRKTQSEILAFGANEFIPWQIGPVI